MNFEGSGRDPRRVQNLTSDFGGPSGAGLASNYKKVTPPPQLCTGWTFPLRSPTSITAGSRQNSGRRCPELCLVPLSAPFEVFSTRPMLWAALSAGHVSGSTEEGFENLGAWFYPEPAIVGFGALSGPNRKLRPGTWSTGLKVSANRVGTLTVSIPRLSRTEFVQVHAGPRCTRVRGIPGLRVSRILERRVYVGRGYARDAGKPATWTHSAPAYEQLRLEVAELEIGAYRVGAVAGSFWCKSIRSP